jgi:uroporphyrinogen decarboxylase
LDAILVIPDAMNQKVSFVEGEEPRLEALGSPEGLARLAVEIDLERLAPIFETIAHLKRELPESCAMLGFCGAP